MQWREHSGFIKEIKQLQKKHSQTEKALERAKRLIAEWVIKPPVSPIAPGKIHRVTQTDRYEIWKFEMVIPNSGLRPNQYPRIWFAVEPETLSLLLLAVHTDNYDNNEKDREATLRYAELIAQEI